jgi:protein-L-isoaspartate(D-aspartate) O-methyltransferase
VPDGCLVAPVGPAGRQTLLRLRGIDGEWVRESLGAVSFVPLLGGVA